MAVKLLLRDKEYQVKSGIALRDALFKIGLLPEATLAIRDGVMITDDELLLDGDVVKLVAVISGGRQ
jgi:sulfur carrier protein ThiS